VTAIDLTYGVVYCFGCHDYVYCDEVDTIAQSQRQVTGTPLGMSDISLGACHFMFHICKLTILNA